jgi:hypothetical protein
MADIIVDGKTRVAFVATGSNPAAFTVAELNAGELLHHALVPTGLEGFEGSTAEIDNTSLASEFDTRLPGRTSFSGTGLLLKKQSGTDDVFDLLSVKDTAGYIVIRDKIDADTSWAATQDYEAYPVRTGEYNYVGRGEANSVLRYRVPTPISSARIRGTAAA